MMDFLVELKLDSKVPHPNPLPRGEGIATLELSNPELIIEFRDNLLDFQSNYSATNIVEFFSHFIDKT
jgi:hypothetical protein